MFNRILMTKKLIYLSVLCTVGFLLACGGAQHTKTEVLSQEEITEIHRLDSISSELDSTVNAIENQKRALSEALEALEEN